MQAHVLLAARDPAAHLARALELEDVESYSFRLLFDEAMHGAGDAFVDAMVDLMVSRGEQRFTDPAAMIGQRGTEPAFAS